MNCISFLTICCLKHLSLSLLFAFRILSIFYVCNMNLYMLSKIYFVDNGVKSFGKDQDTFICTSTMNLVKSYSKFHPYSTLLPGSPFWWSPPSMLSKPFTPKSHQTHNPRPLRSWCNLDSTLQTTLVKFIFMYRITFNSTSIRNNISYIPKSLTNAYFNVFIIFPRAMDKLDHQTYKNCTFKL